MSDTKNPKVAVVLLVLGERYKRIFDAVFRASVESFCRRHGYDLFVIDRLLAPLDPFDKKKFFWQRLLVPSLAEVQDHDYVVTMDADLYISGSAPRFPELSPGMIGAVNERKYLGNYEWRERVQRAAGWEATGRDWYRLSGAERPFDDHLNGGLVIYQPRSHGALMRQLYADHISDFMKYHQDDQSFLSLYGMDHRCIEWIDERYNRIWFFWKHILYPGFDRYTKDIKLALVDNFLDLNWITHWTSMTDVDVLIEASARRGESRA